MKKITFILLTLVSIHTFISCDSKKDDINTALTIQEKVQFLEQGQWLLKGFEDNVMYEFKTVNVIPFTVRMLFLLIRFLVLMSIAFLKIYFLLILISGILKPLT